jgi:hypothetical protein
MAGKGKSPAKLKRQHRSTTSPAFRPATRSQPNANASQTITIRIPLSVRPRGGRKLVLTPMGTAPTIPTTTRQDSSLLKALARAHRWKQMMESGRYASVTELAAAENINDSYLCRTLRLTLLAPEIVQAVLQGRERSLHLHDLMKPFPVEWKPQRDLFGLNSPRRGKT